MPFKTICTGINTDYYKYMLIIAKWTKVVWNNAEDTYRAQERHAADELYNEPTSRMLSPAC